MHRWRRCPDGPAAPAPRRATPQPHRSATVLDALEPRAPRARRRRYVSEPSLPAAWRTDAPPRFHSTGAGSTLRGMWVPAWSGRLRLRGAPVCSGRAIFSLIGRQHRAQCTWQRHHPGGTVRHLPVRAEPPRRPTARTPVLAPDGAFVFAQPPRVPRRAAPSPTSCASFGTRCRSRSRIAVRCLAHPGLGDSIYISDPVPGARGHRRSHGLSPAHHRTNRDQHARRDGPAKPTISVVSRIKTKAPYKANLQPKIRPGNSSTACTCVGNRCLGNEIACTKYRLLRMP